ncbi:MAG: 2-oxo acid dehydrogenase subunit E2, partial [bacterium]
MIKEIILPELGEGIDGAEVSEVSVTVGDVVAVDETIIVLESDKASMEIPADVSGTISEILVAAGDELKPGHLLMKIETTEKSVEAQVTEQKTPPTEPEPKPEEIVLSESETVFGTPGSSENVFASPGVRRLARELGINLQIIKGSGQKGRITKDDLNGYIKLKMAMSSGLIPAPKQGVDFSKWGDVEIQKLTRIKKITGERLQRAWQSIPHVTQFDEADITDIDAYRKELKTAGAKKGTKVTFLPFLMKAATIVLKERPAFNSSLDHTDQNLVFKNYYHLGIAVDTPNGLTVPVVRNVDKKSIFDLSEDLMDLSTRARDKKLKHNEMKGGTFTISSLGGIGGTGFSPIVNPPEVAIMGVSRSAWKQVFDKESGEFQA